MASLINGSLAIKAHATRIKVMTVGHQRDEVISQKTSSTYHTSLQHQLREDEPAKGFDPAENDQDLEGLHAQQQQLLDLQ